MNRCLFGREEQPWCEIFSSKTNNSHEWNGYNSDGIKNVSGKEIQNYSPYLFFVF